MAENKKSFLLYTDLYRTVSKLPKDKAGDLFMAILEYVNDLNPEVTDLMVDLVFEPIKLQLKRDLEKYEKIRERNIENIGKRWNTKDVPKNTTGKTRIPKNTNHLPLDTVNDTDNDTDIDTVNVNVNDTDNVNVTKKNKLHLFSESEFFNFEKFESEFVNTDYEVADLKFYHEAVKNWSASKNEKKIDWIATARNFMLRDIQSNKLQLKHGSIKQPDKSQLERLLRTI